MANISKLRGNRDKLSKELDDRTSRRNWLERMLHAWEVESIKPQFKGDEQMEDLFIWGNYYYRGANIRPKTDIKKKKKAALMKVVREQIKVKFGFDPSEDSDKEIWHVIVNCLDRVIEELGYSNKRDYYNAYGKDLRDKVAKLQAADLKHSIEEELRSSLLETAKMAKSDNSKAEITPIFIRIFNNFGEKTRKEIEDYNTIIKDKRERIKRIDAQINDATANHTDETKEAVQKKLKLAKEADLTSREILEAVSFLGEFGTIAEFEKFIDASENTRELNSVVGGISNAMLAKEAMLRAENTKAAKHEAKRNEILKGIERLKFDSEGLNADIFVESYITSIKHFFDLDDLDNASFAINEASQVVYRISSSKDTILTRIESALDFGASLEKGILARRWSVLKKRLEKVQKDLSGELDLKIIEESEEELSKVLEEMYATKDTLRNYASVSKNAKAIKMASRRKLLFNAMKSPPKIQEKNSLDEIKAINLFLKKLNYLILHENLFDDEELADLLERVKGKKYEQADRLIGKRIRETSISPKEQELLNTIEELKQELGIPSGAIAKQVETLRILYQNLEEGMKEGRKNAERLSGGYMVNTPSQHCAKHALLMLKRVGISGPIGKTLRVNSIKLDSREEAKRLKKLMELETAFEAYENGEY